MTVIQITPRDSEERPLELTFAHGSQHQSVGVTLDDLRRLSYLLARYDLTSSAASQHYIETGELLPPKPVGALVGHQSHQLTHTTEQIIARAIEEWEELDRHEDTAFWMQELARRIEAGEVTP
jgi:hypothetical protein